jgi:hypothetical protein
MASLQDALQYFNTDKPAWYGWKNPADGMVYSNLELLDETASMPSEEDVNYKIAELDIDEQRVMEYGGWQEQLDKLYHDIDNRKLDETGEWFKAIKKVKDDNPK